MNEKQNICRIFLTGLPGVGKTTLVKKLYRALQETTKVECRGFYTEELRNESGQRSGFDIVTLLGVRAALARENVNKQNQGGLPKIGKYFVHVKTFEKVALQSLNFDDNENVENVENVLFVIDEIGKMEMTSVKFAAAIESLMHQSSLPAVLATLPLYVGRSLPLINKLKNSTGSKVFNITTDNRNSIMKEIMDHIKSSMCV